MVNKKDKESKSVVKQEKPKGDTAEKVEVKKRKVRNILLKTIESKTKVLTYWRGKYLTALDEVKKARDILNKLIDENESASQRVVINNPHPWVGQQNSADQTSNQTDDTATKQAETQQSVWVSCFHCKVKKLSNNMHYYPATMTYRCDACKKILEDKLLEDNQPEKEIQKPKLFKDGK